MVLTLLAFQRSEGRMLIDVLLDNSRRVTEEQQQIAGTQMIRLISSWLSTG